MLDRLKFWWSSLSRGVGQLYNAAGWLALIVLILGVAAGIAVPLVFSLSLWLTAVVLMGLFIVVVLEGTYRVWHAAEQERDAAKGEIERRFTAMRYALQFSEISSSFIMGLGTMDVQLGLTFKNNSDEYMRYEIENVSTAIEGVRSPENSVSTAAAIIPPQGTDTFTAPAASGAPLNWQMGSLSLIVRYGHASGSPRYRKHWECPIQAMRQPGLPDSPLSGINLVSASSLEVEDI
jgi:hypothetical protein